MADLGMRLTLQLLPAKGPRSSGVEGKKEVPRCPMLMLPVALSLLPPDGSPLR